MSFLTEAFKELTLLESEDITLDKKGVEKLKDVLDNEVEIDFIPVIDPEMDETTDTQADGVHVGMTILGCEICNTLHYEDTDNVEIDEEQQLANVGKPCPHCFSTDGFKIIGTVAPFEDISVTVVGADAEDVAVKVDGEEVAEENKKTEDDVNVNESFDSWRAARKLNKMDKERSSKNFESEEDMKDYDDKMNRLRMRADAGAQKYNKRLGIDDNATQKILNLIDIRAKDKEKANKAREELAKVYGKSVDELTAMAKKAGFVLKEDFGSWMAAKKLQRMQKNGPKNGEDLAKRKDTIRRLELKAKSGAKISDDGKMNATQKVMNRTQEIANQQAEDKKLAAKNTRIKQQAIKNLIGKLGAKNEADLVKKLNAAGYQQLGESMMNESPYLDTRFDSRKSFYNKARINDENDTLYSYETKVMEMVDGKPVLTVGPELLSQTTLRHIKEWLKQKGFPAESKQQILRDYSTKFVKESLKEGKKVKSTDDLTDDDIFDLVYNKLAFNGEQVTRDSDGNKRKPTVDKGLYTEYQVSSATNSTGIDCIVVRTDTKEELQNGIEVATYYDCLYEVRKNREGKYELLIDYGSGDLEKLLADKGKQFSTKKKGEKLQNNQKYPIESPLPAQTGLRKNSKLDLGKTKAGDPNKSDILVEKDSRRCGKRSLKEDEEAPYGRDVPYSNRDNRGDWSHLNDKAPQWWKDQGGTDASWVRSKSESYSKHESYLREDDQEQEVATDDKLASSGKDSKSNNDINGTSGDFQKLVDELLNIEDYTKFVNALRNLNDEQKLVFMDRFGKDNKDKIKPLVSDVSIEVSKLIPTQSEIDWKKSLDGIFKFGCKGAFSNPASAGDPPLVYNGKYIIDGHHRWSQVFACNPNAKIGVTNYTYGKKDPDDVLKDFQGAVLATTGQIAVGSAGTNVWGANPTEMNKYVLDNLPDKVLAELTSYVPSIKTKGQAAAYFVKNLAQLAKNNKPYGGSSAPERTEMPQTNKDVKSLIKGSGITSMSEKLRQWYKYDKDSLLEGMEDISITTEDQVIKVKATPRSDKETIVPPVEETDTLDTSAVDNAEEVTPEEPTEVTDAETPTEGEENAETDVAIDEIDDDAFAELGESYLKRVYDNVSSFKVTGGSILGNNKIILEGIIKFNSGKKAKTSFILESKEMTKKGRVRFVGMNESISKNKSAYTLTGKVENKKLMIESFNYNYLGKDATTGKSKKLYGTVRKSK